MKDSEVTYSTLKCAALTQEQIDQCLDLFNNHYGYWDLHSNPNPGKKIKYPKSFYEMYRSMPEAYVALAEVDNVIIGQAFYVRKKFPEYGILSWIMQLVVHSDYRRRNIAKTLLLSIWGFSNDYMWGLATSNALTIKTLEASTLRKVRPLTMKQHEQPILLLKESVPFAKKCDITLSDVTAIINSNYPVDMGTIHENLKKYKEEWLLGDLKLGQEWLAFTFNDQQPDFLNQERMQDFFENSDTIVRNAYGRMKMQEQPWAKYAPNEVAEICKLVDMSHIQYIYDIGCGQGRHSYAFADLGYQVTGFDYSDKLLDYARDNMANRTNLEFQCVDCRDLQELKQKADLVICLYDVVGTFINTEDNEKILDSIYRNLRPNGYAVISVMNLELTQHIATHIVDSIQNGYEELFHLPATNKMQSSGNVFDPSSFLLESSTGIVYRKEQFENDGDLSAEYVIRDKRYSCAEICSLLIKHHFSILDTRYVQAGHWDIPLSPTDSKAKEILVVVQKI